MDWSVKLTGRGLMPEVGVPAKTAFGAFAITVRVTGTVCGVLDAPEALTVIVAL